MGGLVTYTLPVQVFVTGDQEFWSVEIALDCLIVPFWSSWSLDLHSLIPYIASFPGPAQLFFASSMEKQEKDARLSPLFCTASNGEMGGAWEQGYDLQSF